MLTEAICQRYWIDTQDDGQSTFVRRESMKEKKYYLVIEDVPITVTKKRVKNLYLRVRQEDGGVFLSAPLRCSDERVYKFAKERIDWVKGNREKYLERSRVRALRPELTDKEIRCRKALLKAAVERLIAKWEPRMGINVSEVTIRQMKTRWGSCNVKTHRISINLALYEKGPECLEYVVVHEMCHILEANHSPAFWAYVEQYYPNWREIKKRLQEEGI